MTLGLYSCGENENDADSKSIIINDDRNVSTMPTNEMSITSSLDVSKPDITNDIANKHLDSVELDKNIAVSAMDSKSTVAILCTDGNVKTKGDNEFGQLGIGDLNKHDGWQVIPTLSNIVQVWGKGGNYLALDKNGDLYYWGFLNTQPVQVSFSGKVKCILPDRYFAIDENDDIYAIEFENGGNNRVTDVALVKTDYPKSAIPLWYGGYIYNGRYYGSNGNPISQSDNIKTDIVTSRYHFLTDNGSILYIPGDSETSKGGENIKKLAGDANLRNTEIYLWNDGELTAWSYNEYGQLGDGSYSSCTRPIRIMDNIKDFYYKNETVYALSNDNTLYAWGKCFSSNPEAIITESDFYN